MTLAAHSEADARLDRLLDDATAPLRNDTRRATFAEYAVGLHGDAERKSTEPLLVDPARLSSRLLPLVSPAG